MSKRCPECLVWKPECICSDPDYRPHGNLGSKRDYMRRNMRIVGLRADERNGLLRREDRRLLEGLRAIGDKLDRLDRLIRAVESLERATGGAAQGLWSPGEDRGLVSIHEPRHSAAHLPSAEALRVADHTTPWGPPAACQSLRSAASHRAGTRTLGYRQTQPPA